MRRLVAYALLTSSLIIGAAAVFTPTLVSMDTDISYGYGRDLVFKISPHSEENYNGIDPADPDSYINDDNYVAVDLVAEEMSYRLENWGVTDYTITKEGYDTIRVRLRTENNSDTEYEYLQFYLPFSGGDISVDASMDEESDYAYSTSWADMFTGQTATIEYIQNDTIPVVVIPVNYEGEDGELGQLIEYCQSKHVDADESSSIEEQNCYVVLWSHKQEGDTFDKATSGSEGIQDANVARRFLGASNAANVWFEEDNEDDNYTRFQYIPSTAAINGAGEFDDSEALAAYKGAFFYMSLFNASDYADIGAGYDVTFSFSAIAQPEVENLIERSFSVYPALNSTMIACLVSLAIIVLVLALFYRMGSLAMIASIGVSLIGTMLFIAYFHAQFGAGMLLGFGLVVLLSLFSSAYYFAKLKDEIYKGRTLKKAHAEAAKKAFWPTIDGGILYIVIGLAVYFLIPAQASMCGLAMIIGGLVSTLVSLFLTRFLMWIYAGDGDASSHMAGQLAIDKAKVPDLLKEEKQTYFGLFANSNFMKPWKGVSIAGLVLLIASVAGLATFSALDSGVPFNVSDQQENSIAYVTYRLMEGSTNDSLNGIDDIDNGRDGLLNVIYEDGTMLSEYSVSNISMQTTSVTLTGGSVEEGVYTVLNFMISFDRVYDENGEYSFVVRSGETEVTGIASLEEAFETALELRNLDSTNFDVSVKGVVPENLTPGFTSVCIGLVVGLACSFLYLALRFRPSRGLTLSIIAGASSFISLGLLSLTRLSATPLAAIGAIAVLAITLLLGLFILGKEREISAESHERDKSTLEFRAQCLLSANSQAAGDLVIYGVIAAYLFVCFLAFGAAEFSLINAVALIGILLSICMVLVLIVPGCLFLAKQFSKIKLDLSWKRPKKNQGGRKSSEPEEAIFIGIND